jgi:hypothetical protein
MMITTCHGGLQWKGETASCLMDNQLYYISGTGLIPIPPVFILSRASTCNTQRMKTKREGRSTLYSHLHCQMTVIVDSKKKHFFCFSWSMAQRVREFTSKLHQKSGYFQRNIHNIANTDKTIFSCGDTL